MSRIARVWQEVSCPKAAWWNDFPSFVRSSDNVVTWRYWQTVLKISFSYVFQAVEVLITSIRWISLRRKGGRSHGWCKQSWHLIPCKNSRRLDNQILRVPGMGWVDSRMGVDMPASNWYVSMLMMWRRPVLDCVRIWFKIWMTLLIPCSQCRFLSPIPPKCRGE